MSSGKILAERVVGLSGWSFQAVKITVDCFMSPGMMVVAGEYDSADVISNNTFEIQRSGARQIEVSLVLPGQELGELTVTSCLDEYSLVPGRIEHLLALGAQHPDIQRKFPIVALGSKTRTGKPRVGMLKAQEIKRTVYREFKLVHRNMVFPAYSAFLAIPKP
ncbi:MAG TPA: hypothetical protein PLF31_03255 [Candidatus Paceibacterota bacterium]|nr:hypothetical protein [Candidatus Paceibacterota bacterium]